MRRQLASPRNTTLASKKKSTESQCMLQCVESSKTPASTGATMNFSSAQQSTLFPLDEVAPSSVAHQRNRRWSNWGQTAHCQPDYIFYPRTVEDLIQIVHFARNHGKHIRAVGSGHSWSALVPTQEVLVNVQTMNGVRMELTDPATPCVIMESGAT